MHILVLKTSSNSTNCHQGYIGSTSKLFATHACTKCILVLKTSSNSTNCHQGYIGSTSKLFATHACTKCILY